jgi:hypothetical protein
MCRSIVRLREGSQIHDRDGMEEAALQYVRKVSGFRQPSQANQATFDEAVTAVANATATLFDLPSRNAKPGTEGMPGQLLRKGGVLCRRSTDAIGFTSHIWSDSQNRGNHERSS